MGDAQTSREHAPSLWAGRWLVAAGLYNLLWGAVVILAPGLFFEVAGMEPPLYPQIWQCVGMIVGVYGIGYLIASRDHVRHWPIVLVGLLGKILGPIGFAGALYRGDLPLAFGWTILTNDLVWWVPFGMMLWDAAKRPGALPATSPIPLREALARATDATGRSLLDLSSEDPTVVVLLRHSGCTFCRETLASVAERRETIESRGMRLALVTMSSPQKNADLAERYSLSGATWISDPERHLYRALELERGSFTQLFGPEVWWRGFLATLRGHQVGRLDGDGFQMPGSFVLENGRVTRAHRPRHAGERVDWDGLGCAVGSVIPISADSAAAR